MLWPPSPLAKIAMAELVCGSNHGRAHGPVFVSPLRPR